MTNVCSVLQIQWPFFLKVFKYGMFASLHDLQLNKHFVVAKRRGSPRAEIPAQFRASRQSLLGSIPRSQELRRAASGMGKVIMKDLVPMFVILYNCVDYNIKSQYRNPFPSR